MRPPVIRHVSGRELTAPVVAKAKAAQLAPHVGDVGRGRFGRMLPRVDGVLFGRQAECVIAERMQHVVAGHALVARVHVGADIAKRMTHMQARSAGIGEHVHHEKLRAASGPVEAFFQRPSRVRRVECARRLPVGLPSKFDLVCYTCVVTEQGQRASVSAATGTGIVLRPAAVDAMAHSVLVGLVAHSVLTSIRSRKSPSRTRGRRADSGHQRGAPRRRRNARMS